jgi:hypothetical protein
MSKITVEQNQLNHFPQVGDTIANASTGVQYEVLNYESGIFTLIKLPPEDEVTSDYIVAVFNGEVLESD